MLTERDTVTADGNFDLSKIMKVAAAKARREVERFGIKFGTTYAEAFRQALRDVWTFARIERDLVRGRIGRRQQTNSEREAASCLLSAELAEGAIPPRNEEGARNRARAAALLAPVVMQEAA